VTPGCSHSPVRTFLGVFAWVTSPLLLVLARRDLGVDMPVPVISGRGARIAPNSICVRADRLFLEDLDLPAQESGEVAA
jgi:CRISPR-associated protein Cmr4